MNRHVAALAAVIFACTLAVMVGATICGCTAPRPPLVVTDPDPSVKIPAIKLAVEHKDHKATEQLVKDLDSDDPAIRFYAINGLRELTGENFGYLYYQDANERQPAVQRWQAWLRGEKPIAASATTEPATQP